MASKTEHAQPPAVVRVIELVGVSSASWSDAAQQAVARASKTLRHITGLDVLKPGFPRWLARFGTAFAPIPRKTQRFRRLPAETTEEPNG